MVVVKDDVDADFSYIYRGYCLEQMAALYIDDFSYSYSSLSLGTETKA
jgi:hypothetical protein